LKTANDLSMFKTFLAISTMTALLSSPISWGLKPTENETIPPVPPKWSKTLQDGNGLYHLDTTEKKVLFTFDLGYEAGYTGEVLDILKAHDIKAIFFLCGHYLTETELVNRMINEGHMIGNHTDKHKDLTTLNKDGITTDIMDFQNEFIEKYPDAKPPVFMRPPSGKVDQESLEVASSNNLKTMMWSVAIKDWGKEPIDADKNAKRIAKRVHPGAIILLHITNAGMPRMVEQLLPLLSEKGYTTAQPFEI
jgi:peptidoglycan-N-acetylmuramic acid deacetylase